MGESSAGWYGITDLLDELAADSGTIGIGSTSNVEAAGEMCYVDDGCASLK